MKRMVLFFTLIVFCFTFFLNAGAQQRRRQRPTQPRASQPQQKKSAEKTIPLGVGHQWIYQVRTPPLSERGMVIYDPYFIEPKGLLATNFTNGFKHGPHDFTFTMRSMEALGDLSVKIDLDDMGERLWFAIPTEEQRLVLLRREKFWALEIHGVQKRKEGKDWILGQTLALLPITGRVEESNYLIEPLTKPISVPAGEFSKGFHSVITKKAEYGSTVPSYKIESWTAEGVGLVKYVVFDLKDKVLNTVELVSYRIK